MREGTTEQVTVRVGAPPERVYDVVSDVTRIPEWSPECVGARWLGGATGPAPGARFEGRNRRGLLRWRTRPRVDVARRPEEFAFVMGLPVYGDLVRWTYRIEAGPEEGASQVTESFTMVRDLPTTLTLVERFLMRVPDRRADLRENLRTSLERLRVVVEREDARRAA